MPTGFGFGKFDQAVFDDKDKMLKNKTVLLTMSDKNIITLENKDKTMLSTKKRDKIIL